MFTALSEAEDWLYTEGCKDATKSGYVPRLDALKVLGDPITFRYKEVDERKSKKSTAQGRDDQHLCPKPLPRREIHGH